MRGVTKVCLLMLLLTMLRPLMADSVKSLITPTVFKQGLIWQISKDQQQSTIIGTMHVDHPGVWRLYKQAEKSFSAAMTVCTEVKMDFATAAAEIKALFFTDGRTLKSVLNDKVLYKRALELAEKRGLPEIMVRNMKPFTLVFMLNTPIPEGQVLDEKIFTDALLQGKEVCALETTDEHGRVFNAFTMDMQIGILRETLANIDKVDAMYPLLIKAYVERDLVAIVDLVNDSMFVADARIEEIFINKFLLERNIKMVERMLPVLKKGKGFFAVGAMHLVGKGGILRLLQQQGYEISVVY